MESTSWIDISIIGGYLVITLLIGLLKGRGVKDIRDYAIANQTYTTPLLVATMAATLLGGGSSVGFAEKIYAYGFIFLLIFTGRPLMDLFVAEVVAPRMAQFEGSLSVGDMMLRLYGKPGQVIGGFLGAIYCAGQIGTQVTAVAFIFHYFFGIDYIWGAILGAGSVVLYASLGGMRSVVTTDAFQFAILVVVVPLISIFVIKKIGGYEAFYDAIPASHFKLIPPNTTGSYIAVMFALEFIPFLSPFVLQRFFMARNTLQMQRTLRVAALLEFPFFLTVALIGFSAYILLPHLDNPSLAFPALINKMLPVGLKGLAIAALLAIIMSTADSILNTGSVLLVHDVIRPLKQKALSKKSELFLAKFFTFAIGTSAIITALYFKSVLDSAIFFNSCWLPIIMIPMMAGLFKLGASIKTFIYAAGATFFVLIAWHVYFIPYLGFEIEPLFPALATNILFFFGRYYFIDRHNSFSTIIPSLNKIQNHAAQLITRPLQWFKNIVTGHLFVSIFNKSLSYSTRRVQQYGEFSILFGAFSCLNYLLPFYLWPLTPIDHYTVGAILRVICGFLCIGLVSKNYWRPPYKKYLPLYWHLTLLICLPLSTSFLALDASFALSAIINLSLSILLLAILADWVTFLVLLTLGLLLGYILYFLAGGEVRWVIAEKNLFLVAQNLFFSVLIGLVFSRKREQVMEQRVGNMFHLGGVIAHEMRTPLSTISMQARNIRKYLPIFKRSYEVAINENAIDPIPPLHLQKLDESPQLLEDTSNQALNFIEMLMTKLKNVDGLSTELTNVSVKDALENALKTYPYKPKERHYIHMKWPGKNFTILSDQKLLEHVFLNLIKNALYFSQSVKGRKPHVQIWMDETPYEYCVHVWDNGPGIEKRHLLNIFKKFYSHRPGGTGVGLAFCKETIETANGSIACQSTYGEYTEFILRFDKNVSAF